MRNRPIYDVVALLARCGVGTVFLAHGWQKIQVGVSATARNLDAMGAPFPTASAVYSTFVELLGGAALILGLVLPAAGLLLFVDMAGALIFVHAKHGIFLVDNGQAHNGFELVLILGLASLLFAAGAGGRITLDNRLFGWGGSDDDPAPPRRPVMASSPRQIAAPKQPIGERAAEFPEPPPATEENPAARPRLAAEMITDTSRDVIVAGKKPEKSEKSEKSGGEDTAPMKAPAKKRPSRPRGTGSGS
jgi:putative oxidoreductase